jgi:hypothetical protein
VTEERICPTCGEPFTPRTELGSKAPRVPQSYCQPECERAHRSGRRPVRYAHCNCAACKNLIREMGSRRRFIREAMQLLATPKDTVRQEMRSPRGLTATERAFMNAHYWQFFRSRKSHCKRGHRLTGKNVYITPNGDRQCAVCMRLRGAGGHPRVITTHRGKREQCFQGHVLSAENTFRDKAGRLQCKQCWDRKQKRERQPDRVGSTKPSYLGPATHCINNHRLTKENIYISPSGARFCRECQRARKRRYRIAHPDKYEAEKKAATKAQRLKRRNGA